MLWPVRLWLSDKMTNNTAISYNKNAHMSRCRVYSFIKEIWFFFHEYAYTFLWQQKLQKNIDKLSNTPKWNMCENIQRYRHYHYADFIPIPKMYIMKNCSHHDSGFSMKLTRTAVFVSQFCISIMICTIFGSLPRIRWCM